MTVYGKDVPHLGVVSHKGRSLHKDQTHSGSTEVTRTTPVWTWSY